MEIITEDFILRQWRSEDAKELAKIADNKKIYDNLRDVFPHPYTLEDAQNYISFVLENHKDLILVIEVEGKPAGNIGAFFKEDVYRKSAEIGYFLGEPYWGRGIMTKVIQVFSGYVFGNYDVIRLFAEPFARNAGSRRVLEKAGFGLEGILKQSIIKNNKIEDSCIYACLKESN